MPQFLLILFLQNNHILLAQLELRLDNFQLVVQLLSQVRNCEILLHDYAVSNDFGNAFHVELAHLLNVLIWREFVGPQ